MFYGMGLIFNNIRMKSQKRGERRTIPYPWTDQKSKFHSILTRSGWSYSGSHREEKHLGHGGHKLHSPIVWPNKGTQARLISVCPVYVFPRIQIKTDNLMALFNHTKINTERLLIFWDKSGNIPDRVTWLDLLQQFETTRVPGVK